MSLCVRKFQDFQQTDKKLAVELKYYHVLGSVTNNTGSGLDDWIYWRLLLQSLLITINYSAIANLPT
jgi:hypothetical protein